METEVRLEATTATSLPVEGLRLTREGLKASLKGIGQLRIDSLRALTGKKGFATTVMSLDTGAANVHSRGEKILLHHLAMETKHPNRHQTRECSSLMTELGRIPSTSPCAGMGSCTMP